jgi:hypothetical protein
VLVVSVASLVVLVGLSACSSPSEKAHMDAQLDRGAEAIKATSGQVVLDDHHGGGLEPRVRGILVLREGSLTQVASEAVDTAVSAGYTNSYGPAALPCSMPTGSCILQPTDDLPKLTIETFAGGGSTRSGTPIPQGQTGVYYTLSFKST